MVIHGELEEVRPAGTQGDGGDAQILPLEDYGVVHQGCKRRVWAVLCGCGKVFVTRLDHLRYGNSRSCGCSFTPARRSKASTVHGHNKSGGPTRTYTTWQAMRTRCLRKAHHKYPMYGGRGITICSRWDSFITFLRDMGERPVGKSIDRIDNDTGYEPGNCRWATPKEQNANRRCSKK